MENVKINLEIVQSATTFDFRNENENMKLSQLAIDKIKEQSLHAHLAIALKVSVGSIYRYVSTNDDNLTKIAAIECLKKETGLKEKEILEREPDAVRA